MHDYPLGENLLAIARAGADANNVPVDKCTEKGIVVFNTLDANANAVKELVLCELFLGGRKIVDGANWVQSLKGKESVCKLAEKGKTKFTGHEIRGKRLGVIGLGAIGAAVANAAIELGMNVIGYDPTFAAWSAWTVNHRVQFATDINEVFKTCDFITLHVPLTPETKHIVNKKTLSVCKDGVVILNNARGEVVVNADIIEAVASGKVSRYITDFPDEALLGKENILCLPHLGASTPEAENDCAYMAGKQLVDYLENGNIGSSVNFPSVSMPRRSKARVCVHLANIKEILSKILSVVASQGINVAQIQDGSQGKVAYLILDLDEQLSPPCLELIKNITGVIRVRMI
ncbi:MAG: 3-phosphoglycerate dehydrogenase [Clostridia bacterium]|nr:3-phosphoglycerate dehydrogenase [Clostridia bacterium]